MTSSTSFARTGVAPPAAVQHARAVLSVLQEAVSPGEMQHVRAQLPDAWARLFAPDSAEPLPPAD